MKLLNVYRMSEDGIYPRVDCPNLNLCQLDVKLETIRSFPICESRWPFVALVSLVNGPSVPNLVYRKPKPFRGSRLG